MGGGLMQLVAYGAQDIYLTGNPQITFFKVVYRRHTNFSMEAIEQTLDGTVAIGNNVSATISRNGDLVHKMYVQLDLTCTANDPTAAHGAVRDTCVGTAALKECEIEIGGQRIDRLPHAWLQTWDELTNPQYQDTVLVDQTDTTAVTEMSEANLRYSPNAYQNQVGGHVYTSGHGHTFTVPLPFWFCRNPGLALPLIALQYHEVKLKITFESAGNLAANATSIDAAKLWVDYIYLDTDERRRFAQVSHEYLIEQLQVQTASGSASGTKQSITLNFNHPVKELIWCQQAKTANPTEFDILDLVGHNADDAGGKGAVKLKLNGHDRFSERVMSYFTRVQPAQHHTNVPLASRFGVYSFALKPEEHQPSGTCNFSRIDNAILEYTQTSGQNHSSGRGHLYIFAVNYNVLRIMSGMGGLAYSN
jgi:hypothetical protein